MPNNQGFLKFIVIFMGILIVVGLAVIVWKMVDLAKQKAAREKNEAQQQEKVQMPVEPASSSFDDFSHHLSLESGERILETTATNGGIWVRIGKDGVSSRMVLITIKDGVKGTVQIKRPN